MAGSGWIKAASLALAALLGGCIGTTDGKGVYQFRGQVIEQATGRPIPHAIVQLEDTGRFFGSRRFQRSLNFPPPEATTDDDGRFQLDYRFWWGGRLWLLPPLMFFGFPTVPEPDQLTLVFEQEGFLPALRSVHSGWFSDYLTTIEADQAKGIIRETEETKAEGFFAAKTGYRVQSFKQVPVDDDPMAPDSGYIIELPAIRLKAMPGEQTQDAADPADAPR